MVYVDTNILVYITANQGEEKRDTEKYCRKLITFDTDFKKVKDKANIEIL